MAKAVLYTDGSATILPDGTFLCGYAYVFVVDGEPVLCKAFPGIGTINQAEMCAVYAGMKDAMDNGVEITEVYTDSTYVVNGLEANREKFLTDNWTNSQGSEVLNKDMWANLIAFEIAQGIKIPAIHIKGHTGQPFNELCDKLAKEAAMSQSPVIQYNNPALCMSMFGVGVPSVPEPMPFPASYEVDHPASLHPGIWGSMAQTFSTYTDDRAKCCLIRYPEMTVLASKGVALWKKSEVTTSELNTHNVVYPVITEDKVRLPMYKYMTDVGTPLQVLLDHSTVQWQGEAFTDRLSDAIRKAPGRDVYIASHNLASMKKFQGIYIGTTPVNGHDGEVLRVYRSERADHGKCMVIPAAYCSALADVLSQNGAIVGLVTNTDRYCLIVTSPEGGIIIGSSVIPTTFTGADGFSIIVDKHDKISTRIMSTSSICEKVNAEMSRLEHAIELSTLIPKSTVPNTAQDTDEDDCYIPFVDVDSDISSDVTESGDQDECCATDTEEYVSNSDISELTKDQAIAAYFEAWKEAKCRLDLMQDLFNYIISDKFKCPEITPQKIEEIEARVRADMKNKLNSLFI